MRNSTENKINIILIRHGATASNLESRYIGHTDEELCEEGIRNLKSMYRGCPESKHMRCSNEKLCVSHVFSSPMKRCIQTANMIFPGCEPVIIPQWKEIDVGEFEGKNDKDLENNADNKKWIDSTGTIAFPNGESREEFVERTMQGFKECMDFCKKKRLKNIACVVHGGTIMAIASSITGKDYYSFMLKAGENIHLEIDLEKLKFED